MSIGRLKLSELHLAGIIWLAGPDYRRQLKLILASRPARELGYVEGRQPALTGEQAMMAREMLARGLYLAQIREGDSCCSCGRPACRHLGILESRQEFH